MKVFITSDIAVNGKEALDSLIRAPANPAYKLVLMDCQMPKMHAYEASQEIHKGFAGENYRGITVIALTTNALKGDREKYLAAGMSDYLSKPLAPFCRFKLASTLNKFAGVLAN
jgi:CheY-like chemotaxis protein